VRFDGGNGGERLCDRQMWLAGHPRVVLLETAEPRNAMFRTLFEGIFARRRTNRGCGAIAAPVQCRPRALAFRRTYRREALHSITHRRRSVAKRARMFARDQERMPFLTVAYGCAWGGHCLQERDNVADR
jgi:hypothetical protein